MPRAMSRATPSSRLTCRRINRIWDARARALLALAQNGQPVSPGRVSRDEPELRVFVLAAHAEASRFDPYSRAVFRRTMSATSSQLEPAPGGWMLMGRSTLSEPRVDADGPVYVKTFSILT